MTKYGVEKSITRARSGVMVMSATIRSALPDCSSGIRLAGLVATSSSLTPSAFASARQSRRRSRRYGGFWRPRSRTAGWRRRWRLYDASGFDVSQLVRLCLRGEQQHTQRQCDFCGFIAHSFPLNPCFVLWTSRSHKLPVGGKEEKFLSITKKNLTNLWVFFMRRWRFTDGNDCRAVPSPSGRAGRVIGPG